MKYIHANYALFDVNLEDSIFIAVTKFPVQYFIPF